MSQYEWDTPSFEQLLDISTDAAGRNLRVSMPGKIVSFNPATQTASVQPQISQLMQDGEVLALPVLVDVPVQFPRAGGFCLTFPVNAGDECLVVIADRCIDGWFATGKQSAPLDYRFHDLSDGFAIPGVSSLPNVIPSFGMDGIAIRKLDGSAFIKIDQGGNITMDGSRLTVKCPVFFEQLFTYQNGMSGTGGGSGTSVSGNFRQTNGELSSNGIVLATHTHTGVTPGGGNTGGPV